MRQVLTMTGIGLAALTLAACNDEAKMDTGTPVAGGARATAMLATATGAPVGRAAAQVEPIQHGSSPLPHHRLLDGTED